MFVVNKSKTKKNFTIDYGPFPSPTESLNELFRVVHILKKKFGLKSEISMLSAGLPAYVKFEPKLGVEVWVVIDDWVSVSIHCNNEKFLMEFIRKLEEVII